MTKIFYTKTDEAPALATQSLLPIIKSFTASSGVSFELKDISLAGRILASFSSFLKPHQQIENALDQLGQIAKTPEANIIKLPNISASIPQLKAAIKELQSKGYQLPDYPDQPLTGEQKEIKSIYDKIKGSAVNPVLREGNSDRRAPKAVKNFAKKHPHTMGAWSSDSKTKVLTMGQNDFRSNEKSVTTTKETSIKIVLKSSRNKEIILKDAIGLQKGEIVDATVMRKGALLAFFKEAFQEAKASDVLLSLHMKATMMKVSDPIIFGHAIYVYFNEVFDKYKEEFDNIGLNPNEGLNAMLNRIETIQDVQTKASILEDIQNTLESQADLAMVNSDKGITNFHVPSDIIIDASMPAMIRNSGKMWDKEGNEKDTIAVIPDSSYAGIYQATIDFCKKHGAFDPQTMGTVPNIGLMAQKAEEYGSHDKTFEIPEDGEVQVVNNQSGEVLISHQVEQGDIWRMCQVKDAPIKNWIELAIKRSTLSETPAVFWLDENRAHDRELIKKISNYSKEIEAAPMDIQIMSPMQATAFTLERLRKGENTISVTGNVLRDYLTDLFPILELGTSAKMLSIVPLMNGGGLFETGAGGSAPKHVEQFLHEGHLRWDSLGEFLALEVALEHEAQKNDDHRLGVLSESLGKAIEKLLENNKSPQRNVGELDNRGSHFYLALFWAEALATQDKDESLSTEFKTVFDKLSQNESQIISEINAAQGQNCSIDGYYWPINDKTRDLMRPSSLFNEIIDHM
jgi:isocitrate dehydrogenase